MSFSFADRLVTQRLRLHERNVSIETENESLAVKQQLIVKLKERLDAAQEQLWKVEKMRESLEKMDEETEVAYREAKKKDEEARGKLAVEYKAEIDAVDTQLQEIGQREAKANRLNSTYKQQIEIYTEKSDTGEAKFDDYVKQRDARAAEVKERQLRDAAMIPEYQEQLEKEKASLVAARAENAAFAEKMDGYMKRFAEVQSQLDASKKTYENARGDKERMMRTMRAAESDRAMAVRRAEQSQKEREVQVLKVTKLQEQLNSLKSATEKLNSMYAALEGEQS